MIEEKMSYYTPRKAYYPVTRFTVIDNPFKKKQRHIQSLTKKKLYLKTIHSNEKMTNVHSNRQLYFLALLAQYNELKIFSENKEKDIGYCAGFHSSIVDHGNRFAMEKREQRKLKKKLFLKKYLGDNNFISLYPELSLPTVSGRTNPLVIDLIRREGISFLPKIVQGALSIHLSKIYGELKELCESGLSDNYYNYENLITISKMKSGFLSSKESMKILFKLTMFSNMALLDSLQYTEGKKSRRPSSFHASNFYVDEIMKRLKVRWVWEYFEEVDRRRKKFYSGI